MSYSVLKMFMFATLNDWDHHLAVRDPVACDVYACVCSSSSVVECASVDIALVTLVSDRET